jgi:hypothetical protein
MAAVFVALVGFNEALVLRVPYLNTVSRSPLHNTHSQHTTHTHTNRCSREKQRSIEQALCTTRPSRNRMHMCWWQGYRQMGVGGGGVGKAPQAAASRHYLGTWIPAWMRRKARTARSKGR